MGEPHGWVCGVEGDDQAEETASVKALRQEQALPVEGIAMMPVSRKAGCTAERGR